MIDAKEGRILGWKLSLHHEAQNRNGITQLTNTQRYDTEEARKYIQRQQLSALHPRKYNTKAEYISLEKKQVIKFNWMS